MLCGECGSERDPALPLPGVLEVDWDHEIRYRDIFDLLPVPREFFPQVPVGNTPLWQPERLIERDGFSGLWIKDETAQFTGSLKDRASWLVAAFARQYGYNEVVIASTGNAGSSMAGIGAAAGLRVKLFVPASAPQAKLIQAEQYGADVVRVDGNYDLAFEQAMDYARGRKVINRNTAFNPLTVDGKKTVALEIFGQLGEAPDAVFVPVGDGVILGGVYKGFEDLKKLGLIDKIPKIYAAQAEGSAAIHHALREGNWKPVQASTVADSIAVDMPKNGYEAVRKMRKYNGETVLVSDKEILLAQRELSSLTGLFAEPAAAAAYAGFREMRDHLSKEAEIVLLITGSGLKDIESARRGLLNG
jgi:threonine synthase